MIRRARFGSLLLWMLAGLFLSACSSGPESPPGAGESVNQAAPVDDAAAAATEETESTAPTSERFKLGINYIRLSPTQPTSSSPTQIEVAEIFWYGCPHCYEFEHDLEPWLKTLPTYVHFIRIPAVWGPALRLQARAFYTAEALGKLEQMHAAFFTEIHVKKNPLDSRDKLTEFFARFGVDQASFEKTFDSYPIQEKMQRAYALNRRYRITDVPSLVINGKYVTNPVMAGSYTAMLALADELVASEKTAEED